MRKFIAILILTLSIPLVGLAQSTTTATATVKDGSGTAYAFGTYAITFTNPTTQQALYGGVPLQPSQMLYTGQLDINGALSVTLPSNAVITPSGTQWTFKICANPSQVAMVYPPPTLPCFSSAQTVSGASPQVISFGGAVTAVPTAGGGVNTGGVYATQLATAAGQTLYMDTQEAGLNTCSLAGSPAIATCTTNTFSCPADTGKIIWGVNAATPGALALADSTIVTCTDANHVTASTNTVISGAVASLRFGHDDTAAWDAINTAYNTLLATQATCLLLPSGMTTVKHGTLVVNPTGGYTNAGPFPVCYKSLGMTYFSPVPDFNFYFYNATGTNIQFISQGIGACCKIGTNEPSVSEGIIVDGGGLNSGTGTCNVAPSSQTGMFLSQGTSKRVGINNWCGGISGLASLIVDNLGNHYDLLNVASGNTGPTVQGTNPAAPAEIFGGLFSCLTTTQVDAASFTTSTNTHGVQFSCPRVVARFIPGASTVVWHSDHDSFQQTGAVAVQALNMGTGLAWLTDCFAQSTSGNALIQLQGSGVVHVKGCTLNAAASQFWGDTHTVAGGTCYDDGGNSIIGSFASDCIPTGANGIWGVGTGVGTAGTTLFLVAPASTTTLFTNTTATTSSGTAPFTGTLANLVCVATAAGTNASSGVVTLRTASLSTGTFAGTTLTATFGTTTSAKDNTHTVAITQGQPLQFQITTQAAETLAGVQCRVSEY